MSEVDDVQPRIGVSWMQVAGSALAAVSSAVILSTLGVAGTVIGAAVGSVVATIGTALYTRTLDVSRQQVAAQTAALRRVSKARSELDHAVAARGRGEHTSGASITRASRELDEAEEVLAASHEEAGVATGGDTVRDERAGASDVRRPAARPALSRALLARLSWKRLAAVTAAVFLAAMVAISAFELVAGTAVSELTGGTDRPARSTVPGLGGDATTPKPTNDPAEGGSPDATTAPTSDPTTDPTADPTEDPAPTPSPTAEEPPPGAEPSQTAPPTTGPTPTPTPSESPALAEEPSASPSPTDGGATVGDVGAAA